MSKKFRYSYVKLFGKFHDFNLGYNDNELFLFFKGLEHYWNDKKSGLTTYKKSSSVKKCTLSEHFQWMLWKYAEKVFYEDMNLDEFDYLEHFQKMYYKESKFNKFDFSYLKEQFKNGLILKRR
jgi:hypothetical protein